MPSVLGQGGYIQGRITDHMSLLFDDTGPRGPKKSSKYAFIDRMKNKYTAAKVVASRFRDVEGKARIYAYALLAEQISHDDLTTVPQWVSKLEVKVGNLVMDLVEKIKENADEIQGVEFAPHRKLWARHRRTVTGVTTALKGLHL